jgi:uncharacterized membrane protein YkvA (DUF1232 family)
MNIDELKRSRWMSKATDRRAESRVRSEFGGWTSKVNNPGLLTKALQLWGYLTSGKSSTTDKVLIIAALLYLICPWDLVPDVIPIAGWLDDVAVATAVLTYLSGKADR